MTGPLQSLMAAEFGPDDYEQLVEALKGVTPSEAAVQLPGVQGYPTSHGEAFRRVVAHDAPAILPILLRARFLWPERQRPQVEGLRVMSPERFAELRQLASTEMQDALAEVIAQRDEVERLRVLFAAFQNTVAELTEQVEG